MLSAIGMVGLVVIIMPVDGITIVQLVNVIVQLVNVLIQAQQLEHQAQQLDHQAQQLHHPHPQLDVYLQIGLQMVIVMMKTIMLIAIGMVGLVVIMMPLNGISFVQLVNVLIQMLLRVQIVKTIGRPRSARTRRTRENATRKRSKRTAKKPVTCVRQYLSTYIPLLFASMS